jgi:hypothetical protein
MVEIIVRVCLTNNINNDPNLKRFINVPKKELVRRCLKSLITSINKSEQEIKFIVIDDSNTIEAINLVKDWVRQCRVVPEVINLKGSDHNRACLLQLELCRDSSCEFVYSIEDDYLHEENAIEFMTKDLSDFMTNLNYYAAINPFDEPYLYTHSNRMISSKIVAGTDRYYRTNKCSTTSIFSTPHVFKKHWNLWETIARQYSLVDGIREETTINKIWNNGIDGDGDVFLFSPIPSLATHVSYWNRPLFYDVDKLWNNYA